MSIDENALKNFQNSNFNFITSKGEDIDYSNLDKNSDYTLRLNKTVVQDQMKAQNVVNTINNEWGTDVNV